MSRMAYCGPRGIRYADFLEWDPLSQQAAMEWSSHERTRCSGCGTHPLDWDEDRGGDRDAFVVEDETCRGCELLGRARERQSKDRRPGQHIYLVPNPLSPRWGVSGAGRDLGESGQRVDGRGDLPGPAALGPA